MAQEWIKMTIREPFPFFYGHAEYNPADKTMFGRPYNGPFYAAGAAWYHLPSERAFTEWRAARLRENGYTVTVESEIR